MVDRKTETSKSDSDAVKAETKTETPKRSSNTVKAVAVTNILGWEDDKGRRNVLSGEILTMSRETFELYRDLGAVKVSK